MGVVDNLIAVDEISAHAVFWDVRRRRLTDLLHSINPKIPLCFAASCDVSDLMIVRLDNKQSVQSVTGKVRCYLFRKRLPEYFQSGQGTLMLSGTPSTHTAAIFSRLRATTKPSSSEVGGGEI